MLFTLSRDKIIDSETLLKYIKKHKDILPKYRRLENLYFGRHEILDQKKKAKFKPDNRLVVNYGKYIVDTFNGFFIGIPIKVLSDNEKIDEIIQKFRKYNTLEDNEAELAKMTSIYGNAFELLYQNEDSETEITYVNPKNAFVVYDDSIEQIPYFGVYYQTDDENKMEGYLYTENEVLPFKVDQNERVVIDEEMTYEHHYGGVPLVEYFQNEERLGDLEPVETLLNALDKVMSEKANDVDYFADAYLKIIGALLDNETLDRLRDSRIINLAGSSSENVDIDFLQKPNADQTQENLIDRLIDFIFQTSQIANISDEKFSNASGVSLEYKLLPMRNLAMMKERKFKASMALRHKLYFTSPNNVPSDLKNEWINLRYQFTRNMPENLQEEVETAMQLQSLVSKETTLGTLSIIDDAKAEIERINIENGNPMNDYDFNLQRE